MTSKMTALEGGVGMSMIEQVFEKANIGMVLRDTEGRLVRANPYYYALVGRTEEELVGKDLAETMAPEDLEDGRKQIDRLIAGEPQIIRAWQLVRPDGTRVSVESSLIQILEANGQKLLFGMISDVTEHRKAENAAEEQRKQIAFVAEATRRLAESLDYATTLRGVADLAVENLADWCVIDMPDHGGALKRLHVAHRDPEMRAYAERVAEQFPQDPDGGVYRVLRSGVSELYSHVTDEMLEAAAKSPEHLEVIRKVQIRSVMILPLKTREAPFGVITFVSSIPDYYGQAQLALGEELARTAGFAMENSMLYSEARAELLERRRTEAALGESEERFKLALRGSPIVMFSLDLDLRYKWIHNSQLEIPNDKIVGKTNSEVFGEEAAKKLDGLAQRTIDTGVGQKGTISLRFDRREGYFNLTIEPVRDRQDRIIGVTCAAVDITQQKLQEENQAFLVRLTDVKRNLQEPDEILYEVSNQLGKHLKVNRCAFARVSEDAAHVIITGEYRSGVPGSEGTYPLSRFNPELISVVRAGSTVAIEDVDTDPSTTHRLDFYNEVRTRAQLVVPLVREGALVAVLGLYSSEPRQWKPSEIELVEQVADRAWSTVERARAEQRVRALNLELEQKVEERTAELMEANRELESFSYSVSHDLRAPLRSIMSASMILLEDFGDRLNEDGKKELTRSYAAAKRMAKLIEDLLQFSRLGRREMVKQRTDLSGIALSIAHELASKEDAFEKIHLKVAPEMQADADPSLIRVALQNLLENAYKFSARSETPEVNFGVKREKGENVFYVHDNGIGFDPAYAHKLFQPFERLHSPTDYPGTGIGLANVKRVIERHGGKIWAEGHPNQGATFYFTLA